MIEASAFADLHFGGIFRDEKIEDLGDGAGRHVGFEYFFYRGKLIACFFFGFSSDTFFGVVLVQEAGAGLDEQACGIAIHIGGKAELACEDDGLPVPVV